MAAQARSVHVGLSITFIIVFALLGVARGFVRQDQDPDWKLRREIGVPGLKPHDAVEKGQAAALIKLYPRDPRVRVAYAEKLVDDGHTDEAIQMLKAASKDQDALDAINDHYPQMDGEVRAVMAEALVKQGKKDEAHQTVAPYCQYLDDRVFDKMTRLNLCRYS